jgi:hypothetical protein
MMESDSVLRAFGAKLKKAPSRAEGAEGLCVNSEQAKRTDNHTSSS